MTKKELLQEWEIEYLKSFFKVEIDKKGIISVGLKDYQTHYYVEREKPIEYKIIKEIFDIKGEE